MKNSHHVPEKVTATFKAMREKSTDRLVLRVAEGKYYVYKYKGIWLKEKKISKTLSEYLGKITIDGTYIKKELFARSDLESALNLIQDEGGKVVWPEKNELSATVTETSTVDELGLKLLTILSMNARIPLSKMAKLAGISKQTTYSKVKALEKRFGINYMLETDVTKLGYTPYIVLIKFEGNLPTTEKLLDAVKNEATIQFAATSKGDYDLVIYVLGENIVSAIDSFLKFIESSKLNEYGARWNLIPFATAYSFMPLRNEFMEVVLKNAVLKKSQEGSFFPKQERLTQRELNVLKELNEYSVKNFSEIDTKCNFEKGASRYIYHKLKERGIISRSTITATTLPIKYLGIITITNVYWKLVEKNRYRFLLDIMGYTDILNRYGLIGNIGSPIGSIMFMPVLQEGELDQTSKRIENELQGSVVRSLILMHVLVGNLCYRRFDNTYSRQYSLLEESGKIELTKPIEYD